MKGVLFFNSVGDTFFLGAHDVENCQESDGCLEVEITEVWLHEFHMHARSFDNDIGLVK